MATTLKMDQIYRTAHNTDQKDTKEYHYQKIKK